MKYPIKIKERVRKLRSRGKTYSEIRKNIVINIPKSTLSNWCSGVILPSWYENKINRININNFTKARKIAWTSNRIKRENFFKNLIASNNHLVGKLKDKDILKMLLVVLYAGEGAKWKSHRGLMLGSSDPNIIKLYISLLHHCYGINPKKLKCRISYRADQNINNLQKYWSRITLIPLRNFYKTIPDPRTVGKPTKRKDYKGVCVVTCGGTSIQLELETIFKIISKGI